MSFLAGTLGIQIVNLCVLAFKPPKAFGMKTSKVGVVEGVGENLGKTSAIGVNCSKTFANDCWQV